MALVVEGWWKPVEWKRCEVDEKWRRRQPGVDRCLTLDYFGTGDAQKGEGREPRGSQSQPLGGFQETRLFVCRQTRDACGCPIGYSWGLPAIFQPAGRLSLCWVSVKSFASCFKPCREVPQSAFWSVAATSKSHLA